MLLCKRSPQRRRLKKADNSELCEIVFDFLRAQRPEPRPLCALHPFVA